MLERKVENDMNFLKELTGFLAGLSSSLAYSYLMDEDFFWKDGFEETLHDPEFRNMEKVYSFLNFIKEFEERFEDDFSKNLKNKQVKIYIGKESPFENQDFSILISKYKFSEDREGIIALLGPKRMTCGKNIDLVNSLVKLLENGHEKKE